MIATVLEEVRCLRRELQVLSGRLDTWEACVKTVDEKRKNALRREQYREERRRRKERLLALPDRPVLQFKNGLLAPRFAQWAQAGMRFAAAGKGPGPFVTWLVHQWNCCTYLKKPVTFSGSSFRVWNGTIRCAYLIWWDLGLLRLVPGVRRDARPGPRQLALLIGGFASYEVLPGICWDFNESRENLNKMLRRVGTDLQCMLRAVHKGLRVKGSESPVPVPA